MYCIKSEFKSEPIKSVLNKLFLNCNTRCSVMHRLPLAKSQYCKLSRSGNKFDTLVVGLFNGICIISIRKRWCHC